MQIKAPFGTQEVVELWKWQMSRKFHPFTCRNRADHPIIAGDNGLLIPTVRGWICQFCDYTQDWAHDFMLRPKQDSSGKNGPDAGKLGGD